MLDNRGEHRATCRTQLFLVSLHPLHLWRDTHGRGSVALLFVLELRGRVQDGVELRKEVCTHHPEQTRRNATWLQSIHEHRKVKCVSLTDISITLIPDSKPLLVLMF